MILAMLALPAWAGWQPHPRQPAMRARNRPRALWALPSAWRVALLPFRERTQGRIDRRCAMKPERFEIGGRDIIGLQRFFRNLGAEPLRDEIQSIETKRPVEDETVIVVVATR
ncbi:MAG: hypothetical protein OXC10_21520 [Rhodospirillaceae bacterium]|nr:hypothetical protein [Rhodospirillaceae bacterium]